MAEPLAEVASQGVAVHGLDGGELLLAFIIFAPAVGPAEPGPVGGSITGAGESLGVDKGFKPADRMVVEPLPISGDGPGGEAEQVRSKMRHPDPGQDKKPGVISQEMAVLLPRFR